MAILEEVMDYVSEEEKKGNHIKAIEVLTKAQREFPECRIDASYELGMLYFRMGEYYSALIQLIEVYQEFESEDIYQFIYEAYILPNKENFKEKYKKNKIILQSYELFYGGELPEYDSIGLELIWQDEKSFIFFVLEDKSFAVYEHKENYCEPIPTTENWLFLYVFFEEDLLRISKQNTFHAMYLYYEPIEFYAFLCTCKIDPAMEKGCIALLVGKEHLKSFFSDLQAPTLDGLNCEDRTDILEAISEVVTIKAKKIELINHRVENDLAEYYRYNKASIVERIKAGNPKILFFASIDTTAVQYHAKNLSEAFKKRGVPTKICMEKSCIHTVTYPSLYQEIDEVRPDIVVLVDHFRFEAFKDRFPELIFLTWVQDPMEIIMDKGTPAKLMDNDFILNHFITWARFAEVGYDSRKIIDAPVPGNEEVYKPYTLVEAEEEKYWCDICLVCHSATIDAYIEEEVKKYSNDTMKQVIRTMYESYYLQVVEEEKIYYSEKEFCDFVKKHFSEHCNMIHNEVDCIKLGKKMFYEFGGKVYRQALVEWILYAGYQNVKLWGNDWGNKERFRPYAMGSAGNGEELSKILQYAKIVLGNNYICTGAARVWETMLSGGFYMSNYVPKECDTVDICKILTEDDFIMFHSKRELLDKIHFYLIHETERKEMSEIGRKKAMEKMTFGALADKILKELSEKL